MREEKIKMHFKNNSEFKYNSESYVEFDIFGNIIYWQNIYGNYYERAFDNNGYLVFEYKYYKDFIYRRFDKIQIMNIICK